MHEPETIGPSAKVGAVTDTLFGSSPWSGLVRMMQEEDLPVEFVAVVQAVRARGEMHDKFWRYLELFRDVIQNSNSESDGRDKQS